MYSTIKSSTKLPPRGRVIFFSNPFEGVGGGGVNRDGGVFDRGAYLA